MRQALKATLWPSLIAAVVCLLLAILINLVAGVVAPTPVVVSAMQKAEIESRTPYDLAPWWLRTRAQSDCQSVQRAFQTTRRPLDAAVSPVVFGDRLGNARPCELLAGYIFQPDQERISKRSLHAGPAAAGSLSLLFAVATGWRGLGYLQLALLVGILGLGLRLAWSGRWQWVERLTLPITLAASCILLATPGSISLFPIVVILVVLSSLTAIASREKSRKSVLTWLPAYCGAALFTFDPQAGSVAAGLSVLLAVIVTHYRSDWSTDGAVMVSAFVLAAIFSLIVYVPTALLFSKAGTTTIFEITHDIFWDRTVNGWLSDIPASLSELYEWLGDGPFYFKFVAFLVIWSLPFVLFASDRRRGKDGTTSRLERVVAVALPFVPVFGWMLMHPGFIRRTPDAYALLVAVVLTFALAKLAIRFLGKRVVTARDDAAVGVGGAGDQSGEGTDHAAIARAMPA